MNKNFKSLIIIITFFFNYKMALAQQPLATLPNLTSVVAREVTGPITNRTFAANDPRLFTRLGSGLSSTNDFGGVPGAENYDIYYSDSNGSIDANGTCITIECRFLGTSGGGGCNIAHLELVFSNGFRISSDALTNFYGAGVNYIAGSELNAVDCNPNTFTTMGNNSATPNTMFLSLTFDFSNLITEVDITACQGDGTTYTAGGTTFNEQNPTGNAYINNSNCYNRVELVNMVFEPLINENFSYTGCEGDNFSITLGNTTFNQQNPTGQVLVPALVGCDTLYNVNLSFAPLVNENFSYNGCMGDNFSITLGNVTFNEQNPMGQALVPGIVGCDTLYTVNLAFAPLVNENFSYTGCTGDNFSITLGNVTFNEQNPTGQALVTGIVGCDTLYNVNLSFVPLVNENFSYTGCIGDNFSVTLGNVTFNEQNPTGQALVPGIVGCDTLYTVNLAFAPLVNENFSYTGCIGDNFSITLGNVTFSEQNPSGQVLVPGIVGCDTLYDVNLFFVPLVNENFSYTGCIGDNFSINLGNITFNEQNPTGQALVPGIVGCDTLYNVNLSFVPLVNENFSYTGCNGDNFSITLGNVTFNEQNPTGQALVPGIVGCDTLYTVNLSFVPLVNENFSYTGCISDNFSITLGNVTFNEQNPTGQVLVPGIVGCDTLYNVNLSFVPLVNENFSYTGCIGDNFSITLGNVTFNEQNPTGQALVPGIVGCDTLYTVNLSFVPLVNENFSYTGCIGDNFSITLGNVTFNEQNPAGQALVPGIVGCDTLYTVNLSFVPLVNENFSYTGCIGDNFSITLGNVTFNEQNPTGQALVTGIVGCDTLYNVSLSFVPLVNENFSYTGCIGDNFSITLGNVTFNEQNPTGQALVPGIVGCDTLYNVNLSFVPLVNENFSYTGCIGDNFSISLGNVTFNEQNPTGQALVTGIVGCDTLYTVNLSFVPLVNENFSYTGCIGDNFSITLGNVTFNEQNPTGQALVPGIVGCDTLYTVNLSFVPLVSENFSYTGCIGDNFSISLGNVTFNEQNPTGQALVPGIVGCDTLYNVNLFFQECLDCKIYAPNVISLSSSVNGVFTITFTNNCEASNIRFRIYNRWGNLVYQSYEPKWDGMLNGIQCESDVYMYLLTYDIQDKSYIKYGDITLLK